MVTGPIGGFPDRLRSAVASRRPLTIAEPAARRAAVAVVVTEGDDPAMLFVKREVREADPWSGHAAFPGGFRMNESESAAVTAQRETAEETGLVLEPGELVGMLDDVYPRSVLLPAVVVTPCVFVIPSMREVRPVGEIAEALWIPASVIFDVSNRRPHTLTLPTGPREFDSIHAAGLVIWGLTERILQQIVTLCK
jgi:ADP-ribose pyrophosphatase YjhB (NUDIX family)